MVVVMLQNLSHKYSNHNNNIKYIDSSIKCIGFKQIHYAINLNVVSSSTIFNKFDYVISIDVLLV